MASIEQLKAAMLCGHRRAAFIRASCASARLPIGCLRCLRRKISAVSGGGLFTRALVGAAERPPPLLMGRCGRKAQTSAGRLSVVNDDNQTINGRRPTIVIGAQNLRAKFSRRLPKFRPYRVVSFRMLCAQAARARTSRRFECWIVCRIKSIVADGDIFAVKIAAARRNKQRSFRRSTRHGRGDDRYMTADGAAARHRAAKYLTSRVARMRARARNRRAPIRFPPARSADERSSVARRRVCCVSADQPPRGARDASSYEQLEVGRAASGDRARARSGRARAHSQLVAPCISANKRRSPFATAAAAEMERRRVPLFAAPSLATIQSARAPFLLRDSERRHLRRR